ncbi:MAG: galactokinase [Desulfosarcinaceae bacterium]
MEVNLRQILETEPVETSAPCRLDMGGTLDLSTFFFPLRHLSPCTFNLALDMRTHVRLTPHREGWVKVSSRGFGAAEFPADSLPFQHSMGLIFATAAYFQASGVHIEINSSSPPRSALGGSSAAVVALITAFSRAQERAGIPILTRHKVALLAHALEQSVAGLPCGMQDQLAATFGGAHLWYWPGEAYGSVYRRKKILKKADAKRMQRNFLLAYCGAPHNSADVNAIWVRQFMAGDYRYHWEEIIRLTQQFAHCLAEGEIEGACCALNAETRLRQEMTPEVLDEVGTVLASAAMQYGCGVRFTGAGGGGCLWALGEAHTLEQLATIWADLLTSRGEAGLLPFAIDSEGVL